MIPESDNLHLDLNRRWESIYSTLSMTFCSLILIANVLGPKLFTFGPLILPVSIFFFPFTYVISSIITEEYGIKAAKKMIWCAFAMNVFMVCSFNLAIALPASEQWPYQTAYSQVLGLSSRIIIASLISYIISELLNVNILKWLKYKLSHSHFKYRAMISIIISEAIGTLIVLGIAFGGVLPLSLWTRLFITYYGFKILYISIMIPLTHMIFTQIKVKWGLGRAMPYSS